MPPPTEKKLPPVESDPLDILPKQILRAPPAPPAPRWPAVSASPFLLLGLVSATQSRRDALRCTWVKALMAEDMGGAARVKFVVGEGALDTARADVLAVPVAEQMLVRKLKGGARKRIRGVSSYSTYSLYLKTIHFMRYAATQREPAVLLGDDDIFVQPHALLFYAIRRGRRRRRARPLVRGPLRLVLVADRDAHGHGVLARHARRPLRRAGAFP